MEKTLKHLYYDLPGGPAYAGEYQVKRAIGKKYNPVEISRWFESQDAHTLHKAVRHRFPRRNYTVYSPNELWEADLADLRSLKTYNDNFAYLFVVIDALSKYAWVEPIREKTSKAVAEAFKRILSKCGEEKRPLHFQTDKGKEFVGREMQQILKKNNITYRTVRDPDVKAAIAERFIRTLKSRIWRYFTYKHSRRYIDVLDSIVQSYNNSWHSGIKMKPSQVTLLNAKNARQNLERRYALKKQRTPKYQVGDLVRVSRAKTAFRKAYEGDWTLELFKIIRIDDFRQPPVYILEDLAGEKIDGYFYEEQLTRVRKNLNTANFEIDEVLKSQGKGRAKKLFVSWKGYPEKFNSWIPAKNLKQLTK